MEELEPERESLTARTIELDKQIIDAKSEDVDQRIANQEGCRERYVEMIRSEIIVTPPEPKRWAGPAWTVYWLVIPENRQLQFSCNFTTELCLYAPLSGNKENGIGGRKCENISVFARF